jgi:hypothetical protein
MGGFIFGYDTGQISRFLGMLEFLQRFGQKFRLSLPVFVPPAVFEMGFVTCRLLIPPGAS